jgi:hypothetical protein
MKMRPSQVEVAEQRPVRLVEIDQGHCGARHQQTRNDLDEKQPMPGQSIGEVATDRWTDGRCQGRHQADQGRHQAELGPRKNNVSGGEHGWDHAAADEALHGAPEDHLIDVGGQTAHQTGGGEAAGREREQKPRAKGTGKIARERDHHHLGDQIGGLDPGNLVGRGRKPGLDLR